MRDIIIYLLIVAVLIFIVCMCWKRKERYGSINTIARIPPSDAREIARRWYEITMRRRDVDPHWVERVYKAKLETIRYNNNHMKGLPHWSIY